MTHSMETPFYFAGPGYSLFGIMHEPSTPAAQRPFVFCHPLGEEKLWTHRVFVSFARQLAALGHPVLRFDMMGNGDSDGSFASSSITTAVSDVQCAVNECRRRTGASTVGLLGLRWGGMVAALAAEASPEIDRLVLWAPIVDGARYMQELLRTNLTTQMAIYREIRQDRAELVAAMEQGQTVNADGYDMALPMYAETSAVKLAAEKKTYAHRCLVVQVEPKAGRPAAELHQLVAAYPDAVASFAQEEPFWKEILRFYDRADNLFTVTNDWLAER